LRKSDSLAGLGSGLQAHRSVVTAIASFAFSPTRFEPAIARVIALGDDVDTLAAMTGALVGAAGGELPQPHRDALENGPRGRDYLCRLGEQLHARWVADRAPAAPPPDSRGP
jgi:poly(ADP-ribose) glycohydrolase ARH3